MAEQRNHKRLMCAEKCLLYLDHSKYNGAIMNISISGALVNVPGFIPGAIMPGDTCSFILSDDPETSFCKYKGRITRVIPSGVGLEILEHEF